LYTVKDISLYISKKMVVTSPEIEISLARLFKWKKLVLDRY